MKQVMIVRTDLKMRKGKIAAQCCHGAIGAYKKSPADKIRKWENEAYGKVVLKVKIPTSSVTVLALGPDEDEILDEVTGDLKLL